MFQIKSCKTFSQILYDGRVIATDENLTDKFDETLLPVLEAIFTEVSPEQALTNRHLAYIADRMAEEYRAASRGSQLDANKAKSLARMYDEVADRFANGLRITPIISPKGKIVSYKVRGNSGYTYSVDTGATTCTCDAASKGQMCWHRLAVEIFIKYTSGHYEY